MNNRVLVLNQDYSPISVCTIQRAFVLVFLKKVELLKNYSFIQLRTVSDSFLAPSVIRLRNYKNIPYKTVRLTRQNVFKRDGFTCQYCGTQRDLTIDHVVPRAKGGKTSWNNLITACKRCNSRKGDNLPHEVGMHVNTKLYRPSYIMFLREFSGEICEEWKQYLHMGRDQEVVSRAV